MTETYITNKFTSQLIAFGINPSKVYRNLSPTKLVELAVQKNEGMVTTTGSLSVKTGKYTGRSPDDRYIVYDDETHEAVDWGKINQQFPTGKFDKIFIKMKKFVEGKEIFVFDGFVGADKENRLAIRVINDHAWQSLFARQLFVRPTQEELEHHEPEFTLICLNDFEAIQEIDGTNSNIFIMINLSKKLVLIGGTSYAGEMKKSLFSVMNYILPTRDVFPMHCSANIGKNGDTALFFGLSGTGKTSLSADPNRMLIGDDEHGWSNDGIFNIEAGCYAKMIRLSSIAEPEIYAATRRFGTILENVAMDHASREVDLNDDSLTENTRGAYPIQFIANASPAGRAGHPSHVVMLTCDAFGVMPPIAKLTPEQARYHFLSGYTAKVAGTEKGIKEPTATFSTCFGAPFMPLKPGVYAALLAEKIARHGAACWLVNTGWTGGPYGVGNRIPLGSTRAMVDAALSGALEDAATQTDPVFGLSVVTACPGVPDGVLDARSTWPSAAAYDAKAQELAAKFQENFAHLSE